MDIDMTHLLESTELHLTSNVLPLTTGSLHSGLDSKPLNAGSELQKPMPLLTDLSEHILTSHGLSWCLPQFPCINHSCNMRPMTGLQIPWAISIQIILIERPPISFLFCFV